MDNKYKILYDDGKRKCVMFSFDDETKEDSFLSVNQYLIIENEEGLLIDPGSESIFDELYLAIGEFIDASQIKYIFLSHQDPDVSGSIAQWAVTTQAKFLISALWIRFMSHYGFSEMSRVIQIPDKGAKLTLGNQTVYFIPAHFLHSAGNFSLYDVKSKILFSGDIGAAVVNSLNGEKKVTQFSEHIKELEWFHKRYMGSNKLCRAWVKKVETLEVTKIAPQHGYIFENENVTNFLEWFRELQCGSDLLEELY
jgi:flavorubredoxin